MTRKPWQMMIAIVALFAASVVLTGCPKKPAPAAGTGPGGGAGPSISAGGTGEAGGTAPGAMGTAPGSTAPSGGTAGAGAGSAAAAPPATGTTIPALPSPKEFVETSALSDIHFDFDKYDIRPPDKAILDQNSSWLKQNANALILIEGHCDERGTIEYNLALGERRAKSTRDYLVSLGIDGSRITLISYGKERPLCTERTEACWARNRRAHFLVKQ